MRHYPKIWFLRHGQTEWNRAYRLQGQLDSPLTEQGIADAGRQAELIAPVLAENPAVFVSPLGRTLETARIALRGHDYQTDKRLMEIHAGDWQGRYRAELEAENPAWQGRRMTALDIYESAPGGEGVGAFHARIRSFLQDLRGPTVIVAHGLWGQVMRAEVRGLTLAQAGHLSNDQGCVYVLEQGGEYLLQARG